MQFNFRHLPDIVAFFIGLAAQWSVFRALPRVGLAAQVCWSPVRDVDRSWDSCSACRSMAHLLPYSPAWEWVRGMAIVYAILITIYAVIAASDGADQTGGRAIPTDPAGGDGGDGAGGVWRLWRIH